MNLARGRYKIPRERAAFITDLVHRVETLPGVLEVTATQALPMTVHYGARMQIAEQPRVPVADRPLGFQQSVTPGYFATLGIPLRRGRDFTDRDGPEAPRVIIINEALARHFWPAYPRGSDLLGQHMDFGGLDPSGEYHAFAIEIVGIVGDVHTSGPATEEKPEMYVPYDQNTPLTADLAIRTDGDPRRFVHLVQAQVLALDPEEAISDVQTMEDLVEKSVGERRLTMILLGSFALIALLLAIVGIYGIITYSVAQRTKELAIRRALGARYVDILWLVLGQGLGLVLSGVVIGIGAALALTRLMTSLLFHVGPTDPLTFSVVALAFLVAAIVAGYVPARRATRIDPMAALR
jgi:putative ABC transport system permease protein